jgi:hypothetical protein
VKTVLKRLWRVLRPLLLPLAAALLFFEEWGWKPLTAWAARLSAWPPLARFEGWLRRVPPRLALLLFLAPAVALFPVKLLALWLIHRGYPATGVVLIVVAKLLGTALVGRLFILTEAQLVRIAWFARALAWWRAIRQRVLDTVRASAGWQVLRRMRSRARAWFRGMRR